jgi:hypothetical protein
MEDSVFCQRRKDELVFFFFCLCVGEISTSRYVLPEEHELLRKRLLKTDQRWILKPNSSSRGRGEKKKGWEIVVDVVNKESLSFAICWT